MNSLIEKAAQCVPGIMGKEILQEMLNYPWEKVSQKHIPELSAAFGNGPGNRSRNDDRLAIVQVDTKGGERYTAAIVCDGVGGSANGNLAANIAISTFVGALSETPVQVELECLLDRLVRTMDEVVRDVLNGSGTTTASIILANSQGKFTAANIGDSRIFSWSPQAGSLIQISIDDTIENELKGLAIKDPSIINARGLRGHLSQAVGEDGRTAADLRITPLQPSHFPNGIVIASDGAWKPSEAAFCAVLRNAYQSSDAVRRIIALASWTGGIDNSSIIAIDNITAFSALSDVYPNKAPSPRTAVWVGGNKISLNLLASEACSPMPQDNTTQFSSKAKKDRGRATPKSKRSKNPTPRERFLSLDDPPTEGKSPPASQITEE